MGRLTLDELRRKYGTEGIRIIASHYESLREDGGDPDWDLIDTMGAILKEVGEVLTEEVT